MLRTLAPLTSLLALSSSPFSRPSLRNWDITDATVSMASTTFLSVHDMYEVSEEASLFWETVVYTE